MTLVITNQKRINFVNRYTKAGKDGKLIKCPHCGNSWRAWHFAWTAVLCQHCVDGNETWVDKNQWIIAE